MAMLDQDRSAKGASRMRANGPRSMRQKKIGLSPGALLNKSENAADERNIARSVNAKAYRRCRHAGVAVVTGESSVVFGDAYGDGSFIRERRATEGFYDTASLRSQK